MARFIFVTGGVCSSLGKGIATASLAALLQTRGFKVRVRKLEQYLNVDSGTMSPIQHGEVFVTEDGLETDLDLGHYERFTGINATKNDYATMGAIYSRVLEKERKGEYLGSTVQIIPHVTDEIKSFLTNESDSVDFILCEIGGTVGDIEGQAFLEAARQLRMDLGPLHTLFVHLTLIPYMPTSDEIKTKPTQHSVKWLQSLGIQPDVILCRSEKDIDASAIEKISLFCNVPKQRVIIAQTVSNIYQVPRTYHMAGFDEQVCEYFGLLQPPALNELENWDKVSTTIKGGPKIVVALVGKYLELKDAYKSLIEALYHVGPVLKAQIEIKFIGSEIIQEDDIKNVDAIIVPGGFGERGTEGKLSAIKFAREKGVPFLGICFGMQYAVIEFARNVLGIQNADTTETSNTDQPIVSLITEWIDPKTGEQMRGTEEQKGGTMRLGAYPCVIKPETLAFDIYKQNKIFERHRHRYEVNGQRYGERLEKAGMIISGYSPDGLLPEIVELKDHPFFVGVQFHPELKSRPFSPHPLFMSFIEAAITKQATISQSQRIFAPAH